MPNLLSQFLIFLANYDRGKYSLHRSVDKFHDIVPGLDLFRIPRLHPGVDDDRGFVADVIVFELSLLSQKYRSQD